MGGGGVLGGAPGGASWMMPGISLCLAGGVFLLPGGFSRLLGSGGGGVNSAHENAYIEALHGARTVRATPSRPLATASTKAADCRSMHSALGVARIVGVIIGWAPLAPGDASGGGGGGLRSGSVQCKCGKIAVP